MTIEDFPEDQQKAIKEVIELKFQSAEEYLHTIADAINTHVIVTINPVSGKIHTNAGSAHKEFYKAYKYINNQRIKK